MAGNLPGFDLPEEILSVLPLDLDDQLDVAKKITSMAVASRVLGLESEVRDLREKLREKDRLVSELDQLDVSRQITSMALASRVSVLESYVRDLRENTGEKDRLVSKLDQLDIARQIMAIASRVSDLESDVRDLRENIREKDRLASEPEKKLETYQDADSCLKTALDDNVIELGKKLETNQDADSCLKTALNDNVIELGKKLETNQDADSCLKTALDDDMVVCESCGGNIPEKVYGDHWLKCVAAKEKSTAKKGRKDRRRSNVNKANDAMIHDLKGSV